VVNITKTLIGLDCTYRLERELCITVGLSACAACARGCSNSGGWGGVDKPEEGRAVVVGGAPAPDSSAPAAEERRGKAAGASWAAAMAAARANSKPLALIPY
jgi:hypothetical protein